MYVSIDNGVQSIDELIQRREDSGSGEICPALPTIRHPGHSCRIDSMGTVAAKVRIA